MDNDEIEINMNIYIYDGTFEGLLCSIYEGYYNKNKPSKIISQSKFDGNFIFNPINIETTTSKYEKVLNAIISKISSEVLHNIFIAFLSELDDIEIQIYDYIRLGFKLGSELTEHLYNNTVLNIDKACKKVTLESHRFLGFVRFKEISDNFFYSKIEPDHNILLMIASHFSRRFSNQNFIIHDSKRDLAILYNQKDWVLIPFDKENSKNFFDSSDVKSYDTLWANYVESTTIKERTNPRLQKHYMPIRYWKNILEVRERFTTF